MSFTLMRGMNDFLSLAREEFRASQPWRGIYGLSQFD
jgi:hypothetical protein